MQEETISLLLMKINGSGAAQSTARFTIYVGHVGIPAGGTRVTVDSALGFAVNDLIKIGEEILQIASITGNDLIVTRGQEGTSDVDHFDGQEVVLLAYNIILLPIINL